MYEEFEQPSSSEAEITDSQVNLFLGKLERYKNREVSDDNSGEEEN